MRFPVLILLGSLVTSGFARADDEREAETALAGLQANFAFRGRDGTIVALGELVRSQPNAIATERARLWRADLLMAVHRWKESDADYHAVERVTHDPRTHALALRGEANIAMADGHWTSALALLDRATHDAPPELMPDLLERQRMARTSRERFAIELAAWIVFVLLLARLALRLRPSLGRLRVPVESWYVTPLFVLLTIAAWARDAKVGQTLAWLGGGALLVVTIAGAAPPGRTRARVTLDALLLLVMTIALVWIALRRGGVVDPFLETWSAGPA